MAGRDPDEDGTWLGLREAAPLLGIASPEALRRRLRRGTWPHPHRRSNRGEWEVFVPGRLAGRPPPDVPAVPPDVRDALLAEKDARIADLTAERDRLLELLAGERARVDQLLAAPAQRPRWWLWRRRE